MFAIPIKMEAHERRRRSIPLLHVVSGLFLLANAASLYKYVGAAWMAVPFFAVAFASIVYGALQKKKDKSFRYNGLLRIIQTGSFLIVALLMAQATGLKSAAVFLWVVISLLLFFAERETAKPAVALFDEDGVQLPGNYTPKRFPWQAVDAVTVRPDFITLHLQQNKLLQAEPSATMDTATLEKLQAFCNSKTTLAQIVI